MVASIHQPDRTPARRFRRLLASLADGAAPDPPQDDIAELCGMGLRTGVAPALYTALRKAGFEPSATPAVRDAYFRTLGRTAHLLERAAHLTGRLVEAGLIVAELKGAVLARDYYPDPGSRRLADIDLLVPAGHLSAAERVLGSLGYRVAMPADDALRCRRDHHHLPGFFHPHHGDYVEVHHGLLPRRARIQVPTEALFEAAKTGLGQAARLAPADHFLHLTLHLLYSSAIAGRLSQLLDLHLVATRHMHDAGFWALVLDRARRFRTGDLLLTAALLLRRVFDTRVPVGRLRDLSAVAGPADQAAVARFERAISSGIDHDDDRWLQERLLIRKQWLERPTLGHALRLAAGGLATLGRLSWTSARQSVVR